MTRRTKRLVLAAPMALALLASLPGACAGRASADDAHRWVEQGATLLDVRTPEEFAAGHLDGAVNIPVQELDRRLSEVPPGKVVVYCRSGARSARAAVMLRSAGHEVLDLGPKSAW